MQSDPPPCSQDRASCPHCSAGVCPISSEGDNATPPLSGHSVVGSAVGLFLVPLLLALAGAVLAGSDMGAQVVGALAGLGLGLLGSILFARWTRFWSGENT